MIHNFEVNNLSKNIIRLTVYFPFWLRYYRFFLFEIAKQILGCILGKIWNYIKVTILFNSWLLMFYVLFVNFKNYLRFFFNKKKANLKR